MSDKKTEWNPRYVAFAASQDRTPEEQKAHDAPKGGARNVDFIIWCGKN